MCHTSVVGSTKLPSYSSLARNLLYKKPSLMLQLPLLVIVEGLLVLLVPECLLAIDIKIQVRGGEYNEGCGCYTCANVEYRGHIVIF